MHWNEYNSHKYTACARIRNLACGINVYVKTMQNKNKSNVTNCINTLPYKHCQWLDAKKKKE